MGGNPRMIIDRVVSTYTLVCARAIAWGENRWGGFLRSQKRLTVTENSPSKLQVFQLLRDEDPSGVSGVGRVAVWVGVFSFKGGPLWFGVRPPLFVSPHPPPTPTTTHTPRST